MFHIGDYELALDYQKTALEIQKKIYGELHPTVAESCLKIGEILSALGEENQSSEYYDKALEIFKAIYGE